MSRLADLSKMMTTWAPVIVLADLVIAVVAFFSGRIPAFIIYVLAGASAIAALFVAVRRVMATGLRTGEELGFRRNRDALKYRLLNRGMRGEAYGLAIACFLGAWFSGWRPPQMFLVLGAGLLLGAWTVATRRWPSDVSEDEKKSWIPDRVRDDE